MGMSAQLTIGSIAAAAQVNVETIRYYQRRGLLEEPAKPPRGQRRYPPAAAKRVRFIKRALLLLEDGQSCRETRMLAEHKLDLIEARIADLNRMRRLLQGLIALCVAGKRPRACPIIATLSADD